MEHHGKTIGYLRAAIYSLNEERTFLWSKVLRRMFGLKVNVAGGLKNCMVNFCIFCTRYHIVLGRLNEGEGEGDGWGMEHARGRS